MRKVILYLLLACYLPGYASAQDTPRLERWLAGLEEYGTTPGRPAGDPGESCPLNGVDSLAIVSPIATEEATFQPIHINGTQVKAPATPDTIRLKLKRVLCRFVPSTGRSALSFVELGHGSATITYRFGLSVGATDPLGGLRYMRDGQLTPAFWNGYRIVDRIWTDSVEVAAQEQEKDALDQRIQTAKAQKDLYLRLGWPERFAHAGALGRIEAGMNAEMVLLIWGRPARVNVTTTANTKVEQWVYGHGRYVYLENGRVTTVQTSQAGT